MRVQRLVLDNYIGIYNGMGLEHIEIDFRKCIHNIIVIKGDNGSGKSTVFKAISPMCDSFSDYIDGKDGGKEIEYLLNDGSILNIKYLSQAVYDKSAQKWIHKTPKCSITRFFNGQQPMELNPSSNITSAKDIIYEIFQLDDNFLVLSELSSSNKGIGSLKPSDRKRYVNSVISSLSDFITMNKMLTKKGSILKSMVNSLVAKLDQIGNIEMISNGLRQDEANMIELESKKTKIIESLSNLKAKMEFISSDENIIQQYESELTKLKKLREDYKQVVPSDVEYSDEEITRLDGLLIELNANIEMVSNELTETLVPKEESLRKSLDEIHYKMESLTDFSRYQNICNRIEEINQKITTYEQELEKIGFKHYRDIYSDQYTIALDSIEEFNKQVLLINDSFDNSIISKVVESIMRKQELLPPEDNAVIDSLTKKADHLASVIADQNSLQELVDMFEDIPKNCNNTDTCPFIKNIVQAKKRFWSKQEENEIREKRNGILSLLESIQLKMDEYNKMVSCKTLVMSLVSSTLKQGVQIPLCKFFGRQILSSEKEILEMVLNANTIDIDLGTYWDRSGYLKMIENLKKDKGVLIEEKIKSEDAKHQMELLMVQQENLMKSLDEVMRGKQEAMNYLQQKSNDKLESESKLSKLKLAKSTKEHYELIIQELEDSERFVKELYEKSVQFKELLDEYNRKKIDYNNLTMNDIPIVSGRIEKAKYVMTTYDQYKRDYDQYVDLYKKLQIIKEHSSINGIQSVYIEIFLNNLLKTTNDLLKLLFNGRFMIKEFVVNESEFSIPCIDNSGQERPDISYMSDSQLSMISMIISFVLLYQASECYNIIKLDEVDASLDNTNRLYFATLIENIIRLLRFEQCIIISHNNEIDLANVDMVLFRIDKREEMMNLMNSGANVVFCYGL